MTERMKKPAHSHTFWVFALKIGTASYILKNYRLLFDVVTILFIHSTKNERNIFLDQVKCICKRLLTIHLPIYLKSFFKFHLSSI